MRRYTAKARAKRLEPQYFKRLHPFRRWKLILSIAAPVLAAAWVVAATVRGDQRLYTSGPVSTAHAMFGLRCGECHRPRGPAGAPAAAAGGFWLRVENGACLTCHDGPPHQAAQRFEPACHTCHVEHQGRVVLAAVGDRHCTQCHAALETRDGSPPRFERRIRDWHSSHPEFAITVVDRGQPQRVRLDAGPVDRAQIALNHDKHLRPGLRGLEDVRARTGLTGLVETRQGLQLGCTYCHRPDERRAYMAPVTFAEHCAVCHPLDFDARLAGTVVPHDRPPIVRAFLRDLFTTVFEQCRALEAGAAAGPPADEALRARCRELELVKERSADAPRRRLGRAEASEEGEPRREAAGQEAPAPDRPRARLGRRPPEEPPAEAERPAEEEPRGGRLRRRAEEPEAAPERPRGRPGRADEPSGPAEPAATAEWVATQLSAAEALVFKQRCTLCHTLAAGSGGLPEVAPPAIPARWLPHARFDHGVHRSLGCVECHRARESKATTDVLLPSIATCRDCHRQPDGARTACVECHRYHDRSRERDLDGPLTVRRLLTATTPSPGSAPTGGRTR